MGFLWSLVSFSIVVGIFPALAWREWRRARRHSGSDAGARTRLNLTRLVGVLIVAAMLMNVLAAAVQGDRNALWLLPVAGVSAMLGMAGVSATQRVLDASHVARDSKLDRRNFWSVVTPLAAVGGLGTGIASHYAADTSVAGTALQALSVVAAILLISAALERALLRS